MPLPHLFTAADWEKLVVRNGLADGNETIGADEFVAVASSSVLSIQMHQLDMVASHYDSSSAAIAAGIKAVLLNLHTIHTDKHGARAAVCGGDGGGGTVILTIKTCDLCQKEYFFLQFWNV